MDIVSTALLAIGGALIVGSLALLVRNNLVYHFRTRMIRQISDAAQADLGAGFYDWSWRYAAYDTVSYEAMLLRFWKPLRPESWYADTSFLRAGVR